MSSLYGFTEQQQKISNAINYANSSKAEGNTISERMDSAISHIVNNSKTANIGGDSSGAPLTYPTINPDFENPQQASNGNPAAKEEGGVRK